MLSMIRVSPGPALLSTTRPADGRAQDTANALVLPGGKVVVFSGILDVARTESALAAVLGHEIAHCLANHHGERKSAGIGTNMLLYPLMVISARFGIGVLFASILGKTVLNVAFENPMNRSQVSIQNAPTKTWQPPSAFAVLTQRQETEADYIGLMMMAEACFDPREVLTFWRLMDAAQEGDKQVPEWLSTHPSVSSLYSPPTPSYRRARILIGVNQTRMPSA